MGFTPFPPPYSLVRDSEGEVGLLRRTSLYVHVCITTPPSSRHHYHHVIFVIVNTIKVCTRIGATRVTCVIGVFGVAGELCLVSGHVTSLHIISYRVTSLHVTTHHVVSYHITSHHITSHHITSRHVTSPTSITFCISLVSSEGHCEGVMGMC